VPSKYGPGTYLYCVCMYEKLRSHYLFIEFKLKEGWFDIRKCCWVGRSRYYLSGGSGYYGYGYWIGIYPYYFFFYFPYPIGRKVMYFYL
jgi:hypothetical protein